METEPIIGFRIASEEAAKAYADQLDSIKTIKETAKTILSSSSIIFALMTSLEGFRGDTPNTPWIFFTIGGFTLILFAALLILLINVLVPKAISYPLQTKWEEYDKAYMGKDETTVYKNNTSAYLDSICNNADIIRSLAQKTVIAGYLMIGVVVGLILLMIV